MHPSPPIERAELGQPAQADPFAALVHMDRRGRDHGAPLPRYVETRERWSGIAFRVTSMNLVTSVGEVVETLFPPRVTMVPGTRSWLKGIANVRGTLLPIIDLAGFLTGLDGGAGKRARVLVINQAPVVVGLLVEEVVGLRHFFREERVDLSDEVLAAVRPYASVSYRDGSSAWTVFDMGRLVRNPQFLQVSA